MRRISNDNVRMRLLRDERLWLETAIQTCRAAEVNHVQALSHSKTSIPIRYMHGIPAVSISDNGPHFH